MIDAAFQGLVDVVIAMAAPFATWRNTSGPSKVGRPFVQPHSEGKLPSFQIYPLVMTNIAVEAMAHRSR